MEESIQSILQDTEEHMGKSIHHLEHELTKIRAGKANPIMLEGIKVDYYGSPTPIDQVASVTAIDPYMLSIKPWERSMIPNIERAILEANIGLNPQSDAEMVRIPIPKLSEERRRDLVKQAKNEGENAKIAIRSIRHDSNHKLKRLQNEGTSEDEVKNAEKLVQDLTDDFNKKIDEIIKSKEQEIMTV